MEAPSPRNTSTARLIVCERNGIPLKWQECIIRNPQLLIQRSQFFKLPKSLVILAAVTQGTGKIIPDERYAWLLGMIAGILALNRDLESMFSYWNLTCHGCRRDDIKPITGISTYSSKALKQHHRFGEIPS